MTVVRIEPDSVTIATNDSLARIPFESMKEEYQIRFGYDPAKARQFRRNRAEAEQKLADQWTNRQSIDHTTTTSSYETSLNSAAEHGKKQSEARKQADESSKSKLMELHSKRMAEENAAAAGRAEAAENTKARIAERKKKKNEKKGK